MRETQIERFTKDAEAMRLFQQERVILEVTERICELMDEKGVSRTELAERLGKTKGHVSQLLDGSRNLTLRTLADVFTALGEAVHLQHGSLQATVKPTMTMTATADADSVAWRPWHQPAPWVSKQSADELEFEIAKVEAA
jgi:transcriptional regulator with XRE-family HTH domain